MSGRKGLGELITGAMLLNLSIGVRVVDSTSIKSNKYVIPIMAAYGN